MWREATCLHPGLVIALDKENGQVCCVCCVHRLCGERWHMDIALDMHLVICRKQPQPVRSVLVKLCFVICRK